MCCLDVNSFPSYYSGTVSSVNTVVKLVESRLDLDRGTWRKTLITNDL